MAARKAKPRVKHGATGSLFGELSATHPLPVIDMVARTRQKPSTVHIH